MRTGRLCVGGVLACDSDIAPVVDNLHKFLGVEDCLLFEADDVNVLFVILS